MRSPDTPSLWACAVLFGRLCADRHSPNSLTPTLPTATPPPTPGTTTLFSLCRHGSTRIGNRGNVW
jgi:hypothetical protein